MKRCKIGSKLLLTTNRHMDTRFRLVPESMTLDDLEVVKPGQYQATHQSERQLSRQ